jgi:hypothetical protein
MPLNEHLPPTKNYQKFYAPTGGITLGYKKWDVGIGSFIIKGAVFNTTC